MIINSLDLILLSIPVALMGYLITRFIIMRIVSRIFRKTATKLDDILIEKGLFNKLSYLVPIAIIYNFIQASGLDSILFSRLIFSLFTVVIMSSMNSLLSAINQILSDSKISNRVNVKSYIQIIRLILNLFSILLIIAILTGKSPIYLLSGLGALTAVLMLVFKDTILSLVSSIQITSNDLFKIGDWIEAPQFGADGDVVDIALHTIKIQNWDKTITTIPTHKLIDSSFKNWRGMSDSGGRRIKRSICIDMNTIKFCNEEMIKKYQKINIIRDYINLKIENIKQESKTEDQSDIIINNRTLTNIGTFRAYIQNYLKNNSNIHNDMTFLVRQLSPGENGLPIEVYVFSNTTDWIDYESIQSDIFDHLLASIEYFDLKIYQSPSGNDFKKIVN
tara:strand:- start:105 stop:1277 length:1173 start_codon:yes stop_codon:yes gene_type:complete